MGAWGYGLLQSDQELDILADISEEAGKLAKIAYFSFWYPDDLDEAISKLSDGLFHQLLERYKAKNWKHGLIYLGALSMRLGVTISKEDMQVLINALQRTRMYDMAKWQMDRALKGYQNGKPWNFEGLGLVDEMRNGTNKYTTGHAYLANVPQNPKMMPKYMPRDGEVAVDDSEDEDEGKTWSSFKPQESMSTSKLGATLKNLRFGS